MTTLHAIQIFDQKQGPLPINASFTSSGGTLVITFSGSGWTTAGPGRIGMTRQLDGQNVGSAHCFANEAASHKVFTTNMLVQANVAAGNHRIVLTALPGTNTDQADWFNVTILEIQS